MFEYIRGVSVCVCVCMCLGVWHVRVCMGVYVRVCARIYVVRLWCVCGRASTCGVCVYVVVRSHVVCAGMRACERVGVRRYMQVCTCAPMHVYVYVCASAMGDLSESIVDEFISSMEHLEYFRW